MRQQPDLIIGGLRLPLRVGAEVQQSYEDFGGYAVLRLGAGAAVPQQSWRKLRTTISGRGIAPPGLSAINWSAPVSIACVQARSIQAASNVIAIPAARRSDAPVYGWAITADGLLAPTPVVMAGNTATLQSIPGAAGYQVNWYPLLSVIAIAGVNTTWDAVAAEASWELSAEEA